MQDLEVIRGHLTASYIIDEVDEWLAKTVMVLQHGNQAKFVNCRQNVLDIYLKWDIAEFSQICLS